jgi:hypothetical protein
VVIGERIARRERPPCPNHDETVAPSADAWLESEMLLEYRDRLVADRACRALLPTFMPGSGSMHDKRCYVKFTVEKPHDSYAPSVPQATRVVTDQRSIRSRFTAARDLA